MALVKRQAAESRFQSALLGGARALMVRSAISREEYERTEADYLKSLTEEELFKAEVAEAEAKLLLVRSLVENGEAVPLCRN